MQEHDPKYQDYKDIREGQVEVQNWLEKKRVDVALEIEGNVAARRR